MQLHTVGIDLGKTVFHLVGLNERGEVVVRKKFSRKQLLHFTANLQVKLIGMEACGGSHFLGRGLPDDATVHYHLGMAYEKANQNALARQQLEKAVKLSPNNADAKKALSELRS